MSLLVKGADLLGEGRADLLVKDGRIVEVGAIPAAAGARVIDADGLVALPGLVDVHTHLREPGKEEAETIASGTRAAAMGGYTAVLAMANTTPVTDTPERAEWVYDTGRALPYADVVPVGAVTVGLGGAELTDLEALHASRARVSFFSDDGRCVADSALMHEALQRVAAFGGVVAQHSQDPRLAPHTSCCHSGPIAEQMGYPGWPAVAEEVIVARDVMLARATGARLHVCHLSTAGSVEVVRWAKSLGVAVTAEVTPHHMLLTTDLVATGDPVYKVNPPLRPAEDVEAVRAALADGTIDVVGTDHAPHPAADKARPFPDAAFGMLGLETAVAVVTETMVRTGRMSWVEVAQAMSVRPARLAGLAEHGRPLAAGEPANIALVDPAAEVVVDREASQSLSRNNPFHGLHLHGRVLATLLRGEPTVLEGALA